MSTFDAIELLLNAIAPLIIYAIILAMSGIKRGQIFRSLSLSPDIAAWLVFLSAVSMAKSVVVKDAFVAELVFNYLIVNAAICLANSVYLEIQPPSSES